MQSQPFVFWPDEDLLRADAAGVYRRVVFFAVQRGFRWNRLLKHAVPDNGTIVSR